MSQHGEAQYQPLDAKGNRRAKRADTLQHGLDRRERRVMWLLYFNIALLLGSICFMLWPRHVPPTRQACTKLMSPASPLVDHLEYYDQDSLNSFDHAGEYRGPPTAEREQAWLRLWDQPLIGVDDALVASLNKTNPGKHYETIDSDPTNPTYGASIAAFHQLRCLSLIRQSTWPLSSFNESENGRGYPYDLEDEMSRRMHLDHCIETIRLGLMCYGDVTPVLLDNRTGHSMLRDFDFNVRHKCRNYERILQSVQDHQVHVDDAGDEYS